MRRFFAALLSAALFCAVATSASAQFSQAVVWDGEVKSTNALAGQEQASFIFLFTNIFSEAVTITNIHTSCGCTTAKLPSMPWIVLPGSNGQLSVVVSLVGKAGTVFKTVTVRSDMGTKVLGVKVIMPPPKPGQLPGNSSQNVSMTNTNRALGVQMARTDRQSVFRNDCATCHSKPAMNKSGAQLYLAACAICHEVENKATMVPNLHMIPQATDAEFWRTWITYGREHSLMPAFGGAEGGPLSDAQITSLVNYLVIAMPSRSQ